MTRTMALRMAKANRLRKKMPSLILAAKMLGGRILGNGNIKFWMFR